MKERLIALNATVREKVNQAYEKPWVRVGVYAAGMFAVMFIVSTMKAMADTTAPSGNPVDYGVWCRGVQVMGDSKVRDGAIAMGAGAAVFGMWRHEQNPFQWAKEHFGTFVACAAFGSLPSLLSWWYGSSCGLT